jgi:homoprotocatechuate degradation regulator HpaR
MRRKPPAAPTLRRRNLPLMMLRAREHVIAHFRPILNAHGITEQQWRIVRLLLDTGPLEPHEIGELCRLSSPSLAGVLSRMENIGFVRRKRLADDQRRVLVSLAPRSRALASRVAPLIEAVYARIEELLGKEFAADFYRALDALIVKLRPQPTSTPQSTSTEMSEAPGDITEVKYSRRMARPLLP